MSKISLSESYAIWEEIIGKARLEDGREPLFRGYFEATIFAFENLRQGLSAKLAKELAGSGLAESALKKIIAESEHVCTVRCRCDCRRAVVALGL